MKAQIIDRIAPVETLPLRLTDMPVPRPAPGEVLIKVSACGVCHTEIDEIEGRLNPRMPVVPGHEIIGRIVECGEGVTGFRTGERVGVAWINSTCGSCEFCKTGRENLCSEFLATGCDANGGYAEYVTVSQDFAYPIPDGFTDAQAAPLLCAGAIGYRDFILSGIQKGQRLGLFGFGASAHIVLQLAVYYGCEVYVFTRSEEHRDLARSLGAAWTGNPADEPPWKLHSAIDFTPVGETVPQALGVLEKGGRLVMAVIRKRNPVPPLDYGRLLWHEREIKSVANITRKDVREFLQIAARIPILPHVQEFSLEDANRALALLKEGKIDGAAVLRIS